MTSTCIVAEVGNVGTFEEAEEYNARGWRERVLAQLPENALRTTLEEREALRDLAAHLVPYAERIWAPSVAVDKGDGDAATKMDIEVQRHIVSWLAKYRPNDRIVCEEASDMPNVMPMSEAFSRDFTGVVWVLDPIDGTNNLRRGLPAWGCSLAACASDGRILAGAVLARAMHSTYSAALGGRLHTGGLWRTDFVPAQLKDATIGIDGDVSDVVKGRRNRMAIALAPKVRTWVSAACCSSQLCEVADGALDGFVVLHQKPWDVAAGMLIAHVAGRHVTTRSPDMTDLDKPLMVAFHNDKGEPVMWGGDHIDVIACKREIADELVDAATRVDTSLLGDDGALALAV